MRSGFSFIGTISHNSRGGESYIIAKNYPIELVLGGHSMGLENMYEKGLNKIIHIES